jgi:NADP-dependent 3-hydroxy acid dehydrogenase YdfG
MSDPVCAVVGVGPGNGAAFARRFGAAGYRVGLLARTLDRLEALAAEIPGSCACQCDAADPEDLRTALAAVREAFGPIDALIYNAGSGSWGNMQEVSAEALGAAFRINVQGLLVAGQCVADDMIARGSGAIVVTGATASLRGAAGTAGFAPAKAGQRALAQSMAKHLGPKGVHVALMILDGVVDLASTRERMPDKPDEFFLDPGQIAEAAYFLAHQDRAAWTFELDLRPFGERW